MFKRLTWGLVGVIIPENWRYCASRFFDPTSTAETIDCMGAMLVSFRTAYRAVSVNQISDLQTT